MMEGVTGNGMNFGVIDVKFFCISWNIIRKILFPMNRTTMNPLSKSAATAVLGAGCNDIVRYVKVACICIIHFLYICCSV